MSDVPAGHEGAACGARVGSVVTDWAEPDGQSMVAEEVALWCPRCSAANAGRRVWSEGTDGQIKVSVAGVFGVRRIAGQANPT